MIKKNRVIVAQFASKEAIANTPHSPRFSNIISDSSQNVNKNSNKKYAKIKAEASNTSAKNGNSIGSLQGETETSDHSN